MTCFSLTILASCFGAASGPGSGSGDSPTFSKSFGSFGDDSASKAIPTADGGYLLTGIYGASFDSSLEGRPESADGTTGSLWAMKLDAYGDIEWNRTFGAGPPQAGPFVNFEMAKEAADGSVWVAYTDLDPNNGALPTGNYLLDGGNVVIARHDAAGVEQWTNTYDVGTIPGLPFARSNETAHEIVRDIHPLPSGDLRVAASVRASVLTGGTTQQFDALWLLDISPSGAIVRSTLNRGPGNGIRYLPGYSTAVHRSRLIPMGTGDMFVITSGVKVVNTLGLLHWVPVTEVWTIDAIGQEVARTVHDFRMIDADGWTLSGSAGQDGGVMIGNGGSADDWKVIELDALGEQVATWDVEGEHQSMSIAANASQGGVGPAGLFFWVTRGTTLESRSPGGAPQLVTNLGSPIREVLYDTAQDTMRVVVEDGVRRFDRFLNFISSGDFPGTENGWAGPGGLLIDDGVLLSRVSLNGLLQGTVVRASDSFVGEIGLDCLQRATGEYVISGRLPYNPENPADNTWHSWVLELDAAGNVSWQTSGPADATASGFGVPLAESGQDVVVGFGGGRAILVEGVGTLSATSEIAGRSLRGIAPIAAGGFIAAAWTPSAAGLGEGDLELVRLGEDLEPVWSRKVVANAGGILGGQLTFEPSSVLSMEDGFLVATTPVVGSSFATGVTLVNTDGSFADAWAYQLPDHQSVSSAHVVEAADGGYLLAANVSEQRDVGGVLEQEPPNGLLIRLDESFQPLWYKLYGGMEADYFQSVVAMGDGYLIAGNSLSLGERSEAWVLRTDLNGSIVEGCAAVAEAGPWPAAGFVAQLSGSSQSTTSSAALGLPDESIVVHAAAPVAGTTVARQCSGTAAPPSSGGGGGPSGGQYTLTVVHEGGGQGLVESFPTGISCGSTCAFDFVAGTTVSLTPTPIGTSVFSHWEGVDVNSGVEGAEVVMNANRTVRVWFE